MKKLYPFIIALFIFPSFLLHAQSPSTENVDPFVGEEVVGIANCGYYFGGGSIYNTTYAATQTDIYYRGDPKTDFKKISLPAGNVIVKTGVKEDTVRITALHTKTIRKRFTVMAVDGTDTVLYIIDPKDPGEINPYTSVQLQCFIGTGSDCSSSITQLFGEGIYVLTNQYLFGTHDDGKTWLVDSAGLGTAVGDINQVAMDTSWLYLYAGTRNGLFKQDTLTEKWSLVNTYPGGATRNATAVFIDRKNRILVQDNSVANLSDNICNISTDNGATWHTDTTGLNFDGQTGVVFFGDDAYGNLYAVTRVGFEYATAIYHIYKSLHGTGAWQLIDTSLYNLTGNYRFSIGGVSGDSVLYVNTSAGLFKSIDGGTTWADDNGGISSKTIGGFAKTKSGRILAGNILGINYVDAGNPTPHKAYPLKGFLNNPPLYQDSLNNLYSLDASINPAYTTYPVIKSADNGNTWTVDSAGLYNVPNCAGNFFVDETGGQHFFSSSQAFVESKSNGGTWKVDTSGFNNASSIFAMGTDGKGYIYASGRAGGGAIKRRPVAGGIWVLDTAGIPSTYPYFPKVASSGKHVFVYTNINYAGKLFRRSADKWHSIPLPPSNTFYSPYVAAVSQDKSGYIYAAFYLNKYSSYEPFGVYYTKDTGQTWTLLGLDSVGKAGKFGQGVKSLVSYGDTTYAITEANGIYMFTHSSALPVTLSPIKAYPLGKGIQVEWSGYNEVSMSGYEVEKSANGNQFIKIGSIPAKGITNGENKYGLFDAAPFNGDNFYRIKAINKDGSAQFSGVVKVNIANNKTGIEVFPNPAVNKIINVQLNNVEAGKYTLSVYSAVGQLMYARSVTHPGGNAAIGINLQNTAKGIYWVTLMGPKHTYNKTIAIQ